MVTCVRCQSDFDVAETTAEYESHFNGELEYDDNYGGEVCAACAIPDSEGLIDQGRAIDMVNGDENYDDGFVEKHL